MSRGLNFLRIIGKAAYLIGVLMFFNFFFGLLFFRFFFWLILGAVLLVLFTGALSIGKNILFTNFSKTNTSKTNTAKSSGYKKGDVIDVEAEVFESREQS